MARWLELCLLGLLPSWAARLAAPTGLKKAVCECRLGNFPIALGKSSSIGMLALAYLSSFVKLQT